MDFPCQAVSRIDYVVNLFMVAPGAAGARARNRPPPDAGRTGSPDFPTVNPYQGVHAGGFLDVFVTKILSSVIPPLQQPPDVSRATPSIATLWPPNHKLVQITANIQVSDLTDSSPRVVLVSITSNEPDNGLGDGNTANDIQGATLGTDDRSFSLRAERSGKGTGRIYTVTYQATDASGNTTITTANVTVPHDQGKK